MPKPLKAKSHHSLSILWHKNHKIVIQQQEQEWVAVTIDGTLSASGKNYKDVFKQIQKEIDGGQAR